MMFVADVGIRFAGLSRIDRQISPYVTADYGPWSGTRFAPIDPDGLTQFVDDTAPIAVALLSVAQLEAPAIGEATLNLSVSSVPITPTSEILSDDLTSEVEPATSTAVAVIFATNTPRSVSTDTVEESETPDATLVASVLTNTTEPIASTNTSIPPTITPVPLPTNTPIPLPTNTPMPPPTNTPIPLPTSTPVLPPTNTPHAPTNKHTYSIANKYACSSTDKYAHTTANKHTYSITDKYTDADQHTGCVMCSYRSAGWRMVPSTFRDCMEYGRI